VRIALAQQHAWPDHEDNVARGLEVMERAREAGADLIAFAELCFLRFFPARRRAAGEEPRAEPIPGPTTERFQRKARELGLVTLINLYEADGERRFDASPVIDADGALLGVTRMLHITDFTGFHEQDYYDPGDRGAAVYATRAGRVGVAICYDRHYPEVMRGLGLQGAQVVVVPQAGTRGEWPAGLYEAELRVAAFQNGYHAALVNRVGDEGDLVFSGESFVVDAEGRVVAQAGAMTDELLLCDLDLEALDTCTARRLFLRDRRPEVYGRMLGLSRG
jgi:N-carbamoylputrescine amidase